MTPLIIMGGDEYNSAGRDSIPDTHFSGRRVLSVEIVQAPVRRLAGNNYMSTCQHFLSGVPHLAVQHPPLFLVSLW